MKNRMKKLLGITISGLMTLSLLIGCDKEELESSGEARNLLEEVEAQAPEDIEDLPNSFLESNANFSLKLFKELADEENAVFSPVPVYYSLALLANGADAEAVKEIFQSLALSALDQKEVNNYYHELIQRLETDHSGLELNVSNSIWVNQDFKANPEFLVTNKSYYEADSFKIDFLDKNTPVLMNDWVTEATNGKIEKLIEEMNPEAVMYLFSTIYFDADWEMPFKATDSYESDFFLDGEKLAVEKMSGRFELETLETADEEGVILPYKEDDYSFVALLPNEDTTVRDYLMTLHPEKMKTLIAQVKNEEVDLLLPKFEVNFEKVLNRPLKELGIYSIFDQESDSLNRMGEADGKLYVTEIFQKTYLSVDEEGTEAASAVGTEIAEMSLPMETRTIDFNRPFLYGVIENETGLPIFLGVMDRPGN